MKYINYVPPVRVRLVIALIRIAAVITFFGMAYMSAQSYTQMAGTPSFLYTLISVAYGLVYGTLLWAVSEIVYAVCSLTHNSQQSALLQEKILEKLSKEQKSDQG